MANIATVPGTGGEAGGNPPADKPNTSTSQQPDRQQIFFTLGGGIALVIITGLFIKKK